MIDYFIQGTLLREPEYNSKVYGIFKLGEFGDDVGIALKTSIAGYKKGTLTISTKLDLIGFKDGLTHVIISFRYGTVYGFENQDLITRGTTKRAIATLKDCIDLAQAHAFGHFSSYCQENELPMLGTAVQPFEQTEKAILDFLKSINTLYKR